MGDLDLVIRQASLRGRTGLFDVGISDGRITAISPSIPSDAREVIQCEGNLVTESFVNPHLHLDKVYTLAIAGEASLRAYTSSMMGGAMAAIDGAARVKELQAAAGIADNARRAVNLALSFGTTHMRAFADVDTKARLEGVKALLEVREEFRGRLTLQLVAFPQQGLLRDAGAEELVLQAIELGADVVGGIPWIEYTERDAQSHIDRILQIAIEHDRDVSMLVDDTGDLTLRTLEMLAISAAEHGWSHRVLAHHARAMALYPEAKVQRLMGLLRRSGVALVCDPHTAPLHLPVQQMLAAGVTVCLGQDDISDAYYAYGRNNMVEVAFLASHMLWMTTSEDRERLYEMITVRAAQAIGVRGHVLEVGAPANLVILDGADLLDVFRHHAAPLHVISNGRLLAGPTAARRLE